MKNESAIHTAPNINKKISWPKSPNLCSPARSFLLSCLLNIFSFSIHFSFSSLSNRGADPRSRSQRRAPRRRASVGVNVKLTYAAPFGVESSDRFCQVYSGLPNRLNMLIICDSFIFCNNRGIFFSCCSHNYLICRIVMERLWKHR